MLKNTDNNIAIYNMKKGKKGEIISIDVFSYNLCMEYLFL